MGLLKSKNEKVKARQFTMYPSTDKRLSEIANKYNISRSKVLEYLISTNYKRLMSKKED